MMQATRIPEPADISSLSSRKLWELLYDHTALARRQLLAKAITEELYRRGDFRPQGWSIAPV